MKNSRRKFGFGAASCLVVMAVGLLGLAACDVELRKSDAELGLNPQQAVGRRVYDQHCQRCHEAYSSRSKKADSLQGIFKRPFLRKSGLPANDERVAEIVRSGRTVMPAFGQVLTDQQIQDLLAYLHTL